MRPILYSAIIITLFLSGCEVTENRNSVREENSSLESEKYQNPIAFPTGTFKAVETKIELPTGQTAYASDFHTFDATLEVKGIGKDLISYELNARLRMRASTQEKKDRRFDKFKIVWADDNSGKLVNQDPTYRKDKTDFRFSGDELVVKSWVSRHNITETQTYRSIRAE